MHFIALENQPSSCRGGQEISLFYLCYGLAQRGHTISLIYTKEGDLLEKYQSFCKYLVKAYQLTIYPPPNQLRFLIDILNINRKIPTTKNSIVLANQPQDTYFGRALALSKNIPLVCWLRLPPFEKVIERKGVKQFIRDLYKRWQWEIGLQGVNNFIAVSNQTKSDWVKRGYREDVIDVVHNGIDMQLYKPKSDFYLTRKQWNMTEDIRVISYVGRLDKNKGLETLIKVFALLVKNGANTRLLIAGKPLVQGEDYKKSLQQLLIGLGIENYVDFLGHVTNTTNIYQVSDVTVLPSIWSEPFGRVIIESMACGTPVVASRTGGIPEILTGEFQNGLFEPGNERDLFDTLNQIINWRDKNPHLGERCHEYSVSKFGLETSIDNIEKVIKWRFRELFP